jgi:hypothetical protein
MFANRSPLIINDFHSQPITNNNLDAIRVYPNPTSSDLHIITPADFGSTLGILQDLLGKEMKAINLHTGDNLISVSDLPAGVYILVLKNSNSTVTKKITIQ